jgi:3-hydroxyisobutyrate dehydrogenase-like beta-hydroxyacid dehydrogenase
MPKLGFLGLGLMGYPMARNLLRAGHEVAVWSHTSAKAQEFVCTEKGRFCATPKEVAENADVLFLCVGDTEMAKEVILGANGIIEGVRPGSVVVDCSTIAVSQSRHIAQALKAKGVDFLDAPITGSTPGAESGKLTFMIGGDAAVFNRIRPLLDPLGKKVYFCGAAGMGLQAKLTQNLILSNILMAFNEGMVLATKGGMDPELMLEILNNSAAKSGLINYKAPFVFARNFTTNFSVKWMFKDIGLMLERGQELGVPLVLTGLTRQLFRTAIAAGHGDEDICSTIKVLEKLAGVEVVSKK